MGRMGAQVRNKVGLFLTLVALGVGLSACTDLFRDRQGPVIVNNTPAGDSGSMVMLAFLMCGLVACVSAAVYWWGRANQERGRREEAERALAQLCGDPRVTRVLGTWNGQLQIPQLPAGDSEHRYTG